ncbi:MAG: excinuclease ABC subunit C [Candidatus Zambryskibacteria bacterium CG10_big_fil_rev_8_21_14_0_10_42_12]|uniref:Excinuclease ABC subunit C n=1 Tax=Candidatus Zambryskibacteria bacterium CG10_big_fil_rev_8_21_14_0_10_42_12 TaxID=1975115 RepID=A0A2H0QWD5_9BACT|nr:MAG: excinuclease ABC subunit C [Candidatus Zambryskibacteria bacterium CG10_big_fil_rev_8_21_14_0_10_42_12]
MYYTYVLKSQKDYNLYVGWTDDLKARILAHNSGKVIATKPRTPLSLVYYEACLSKEKAIAREKYLKSGFGRKFLKSRI